MPVTRPNRGAEVKGAGRRTALYQDTKKKQSLNCIIEGSGTGQTVNIWIPSQHRRLTNVPLATATKGSNAAGKVAPRTL